LHLLRWVKASPDIACTIFIQKCPMSELATHVTKEMTQQFDAAVKLTTSIRKFPGSNLGHVAGRSN
jgi:hypothetical protein